MFLSLDILAKSLVVRVILAGVDSFNHCIDLHFCLISKAFLT